MLRSACLALALYLPASAASSQTPDVLVARHLEWRGGAAFQGLRSIHSRGTIETSGLSGVLERWNDGDGRARTDIDLGVLRVSEGYSDGAGWTVTPSGQVEDASTHAVAAASREGAVLFGRFEGARLSLLPSAEPGVPTSAGLRADFGDGAVYDLRLDPDTGALLSLAVTEDGETRTISYGDWRVVDGVRMPFREEVDYPGDAQDQSIRVESLEVNESSPAAVFERPVRAAKLSFAPGAVSSGPVPFDLYAGRRLYLPAVVQGHPVEVLLDSGAETTVLDSAFAERIGLKVEGAVSAEGTGGRDTVGLASGVTIRLGGATLADLTVAVMDLSGLASRLGRPLPVILGKEVLNEAVVDVNFAARHLEVYDPQRFTLPAEAFAIPALSMDGVRTVPISIEGREPVQATFDLGNGSPLIVFPRYAERERLLDGRPASRAQGGGVGGVRVEPITTLRRVGFGGVEFGDVPATFPAPGTAVFDTDRAGANVGLPMISRFRLITDFPHNRIFLIPRPDADRPFDRDRAGLRTRTEGDRWIVDFVAPDSPAEAGGWMTGDAIVLMNGRPVADLTPNEWIGGPEGSQVSLTLSNGARRVLTLRDYF